VNLPISPPSNRRARREATLLHLGCAISKRLKREAMSSIARATQVDKARECMMDELNGRMMACQILVTGLIARVANNSPDPLRFLTDFRDEIKAVVKGVNIAGMDNTDRVRQVAQTTVDELFSLMKPPSVD
jgi:putative N-acetylmannosamine-6-phosphate epimerase